MEKFFKNESAYEGIIKFNTPKGVIEARDEGEYYSIYRLKEDAFGKKYYERSGRVLIMNSDPEQIYSQCLEQGILE